MKRGWMVLVLALGGCGDDGASLPAAADPASAPVASVDRFGDGFATLFKRSDPVFDPSVMGPLIPGPNEPIDMDAVFLTHALGPEGARITYYGLDVTSDQPGRVYRVARDDGSEVVGQLPIVETLPGDEGHNDFLWVHEARLVGVDDYRANQLASLADLRAAEAEGAVELVPTRRVVNWAMVPAGTVATLSFDGEPVAGGRAWRDREVVHYLAFDRDLELTGADEVPGSNVSVIFENGMDPSEGFATEADGVQTHNVVETLPGQSRYSSFWAHQVGSRAGFDGVTDWDSAIANYQMDLPIAVNCPVVE